MSSSTKLVLCGICTRIMGLKLDSDIFPVGQKTVRNHSSKLPLLLAVAKFSDCFIATKRPSTSRTKKFLQSISLQASLETKIPEADEPDRAKKCASASAIKQVPKECSSHGRYGCYSSYANGACNLLQIPLSVTFTLSLHSH